MKNLSLIWFLLSVAHPAFAGSYEEVKKLVESIEWEVDVYDGVKNLDQEDIKKGLSSKENHALFNYIVAAGLLRDRTNLGKVQAIHSKDDRVNIAKSFSVCMLSSGCEKQLHFLKKMGAIQNDFAYPSLKYLQASQLISFLCIDDYETYFASLKTDETFQLESLDVSLERSNLICKMEKSN
ncbi:MAG TPA: hypothetical protein VFX02_00950 [Gammaproteobacteria bacterium]|nr:hypothetical protein [Gammaproteobacteria bacterium]